MAAAKTASEPALRDLAAEIQRASIKARAELDDVRRRLDTLRAEREGILSAPLAACDLLPELERHMRIKAREAVDYLRETLAEMRDKTGRVATVSPDTIASFAPLDRSYLSEIIACLVDPHDAAKRLLTAAGELPGVAEGLPLEQRRAKVGDLDKQIAAAVETESALVESLAAAGIQVPVEHAREAEPVPGERRMIDGKIQEWTSFTGGRNFGWWPVEQAA